MAKRTNNNLQNIRQKTKDRATRTLLKPGGKLRCSGRISSSFSTFDIGRVTLVTNSVISHKWGKDRIVNTTSEHIRGHLWYWYPVTVNQVKVVTIKLSKWCLYSFLTTIFIKRFWLVTINGLFQRNEDFSASWPTVDEWNKRIQRNQLWVIDDISEAGSTYSPSVVIWVNTRCLIWVRVVLFGFSVFRIREFSIDL